MGGGHLQYPFLGWATIKTLNNLNIKLSRGQKYIVEPIDLDTRSV